MPLPTLLPLLPLLTLLPLLLVLQLFPQPATAHQYIVSFNTYHPISHQTSLLKSILILTPPPHYTLQPRSNPSTPYPTDFLLLHTTNPHVLQTLNSSPHIRHLHRQRLHQRFPTALTRHQTPDETLSTRPTTPAPRIHPFNAGALWRRNILGQNVTVAVFDTGLLPDDRYFAHPVRRSDWTGDNATADPVGHGTFVAGLIAARHPACPGIAPAAQLHLFRVFTAHQVSYTSWFLDAFNYALHVGIDVLNLSVGGPDFADVPFTDKVNELTANGVVVVSAIGNDGPLWGSLNNPGDMMDVIGVGGVEADGAVASFSSRGMTTQEVGGAVGGGYGRAKPDLVTYARGLVAPSHKGVEKCRKLSGTSVASPVVAGAIALLMSSIPLERRKRVANPASIKLVLARSCRRLARAGLYEQGAGLLDIEGAYEELMRVDSQFVQAMKGGRGVEGPQAGFFPPFYDLTKEGCPYMWPHCAQGLYVGGLTVTLNVTVLNPGGAEGRVENVTWVRGSNGQYLDVEVTPPLRFWPWAAGMGVHLTALPGEGDALQRKVTAQGVLKVRIASIHKRWHSDIELPIRADIIPTPPREKRLLWDIYHSIRYPPGYVPRDSLAEEKDMLDWLGDHPHTNFHELYRALLKLGFYVDILDSPLTCLRPEDLRKYGAVLLLDSEDYFTISEKLVLERMVKQEGLALIAAAEWYNVDVMHSLLFQDDNTRSWWSPVTAGANVPALNEVLAPFDIAFGDYVMSGDIRTSKGSFRFESGVPIVQFPSGGELLYVSQLKAFESNRKTQDRLLSNAHVPGTPLLGLTKSGRGAVLVYGDTNCIDTAYNGDKCYGFFAKAVHHAVTKCATAEACGKFLWDSKILETRLTPDMTESGRLARPLSLRDRDLFKPHSNVLTWFSLTELKGNSSTARNDIDEPVCKMRTKGRRRPVIALANRESIVLPQHRRAEPVGSEGRYFQSLRTKRLYAFDYPRYGEQAAPRKFAFRVLGAQFVSSFRTRSMVAISLGASLILFSVLIRHRRFWLRQLRKGVRLVERSRSRYSNVTSQSTLTDCEECVSQTLSSLLSIHPKSAEGWTRPVDAP